MSPSPQPRDVYRRLLRDLGPQGWWPVTPRGGLRPRYRPGSSGGLTERQRLEICVGAILTQNTSWGNVESSLRRLSAAGLRELPEYLAVSLQRLERLIRSSGYFHQKAMKLKAFMRHLEGRGGRLGSWLSVDLKTVRPELLDIYGIGPETADSILLYAGARAIFVVDAYTLRIGRRLGWFRTAAYERAQDYLCRRLPVSAVVYREFHALIVRLAKDFCHKNKPLCLKCPLKEICRYGQSR